MKELKHEQLTQIIRRMIVSGDYKPGDTLPSQNEMGRMYGMNPTTVREAIASLVHEGLVVRIRGKGTFVNNCKRSGPLTIGLATYLLTGIGDDDRLVRASDFNARLIHGVTVEAQEHGAGVLFALNLPDPEIEKKNLYNFIDRQVDAVIMQLYFKEENIDALKDLQEAGIPLILADRYAEYFETDYVVSDNFGGARQAMDVILDRGFTDTLFFRLKEDASTLREREAGFRSSMHTHGLSPEGRVISLPGMLSPGWCEIWDSAVREALAKLTAPIGVFVYASPAFLELMPLIEELGIPHDQIALVSFDEPAPRLIPDDILFVNVIQPVEEMGRTAVRMALDRLQGANGFQQVRLSPTIRVSQSDKALVESNRAESSLVIEH